MTPPAPGSAALTPLSRRTLLAASVAAVALPASAQEAWSPTSPVRIIVPSPPGEVADLLMRMLAERLQPALGQPVVVENRPGAGGTVGMEYAANQPADGTAAVMGGKWPTTIAPSLHPHLGYDPLRDMTPIALIASVPQLFVVNKDFPVNAIGELVARARANPGAIFYASPGNGTTQHLNMELFASMTGVQLTHVPYRGSGPALADLIAGQVSLMSDTLAALTGPVRGGQLRAIAVTSAERSPFFPDVPTVAEQHVPGYASVDWIGLLGPRDLPDPIAARFEQEVARILRQAQIRQRLAEAAFTPSFLDRRAFADFIASETTTWREVVQKAGVRLD
ncbi:LacI family transcriptional regulator [Falsiroseomonas bella]|uniref:LacI family transcriptional regulator n=1 Tax=Falsiroseomonas bella TaxID=2184016 RepID=A0A317FB14_9PROT|nr:tripartite tricarboxylate transporter substrate binding protein [Falsiroseomonas bella]PWS36310.1 LacI family transcriptional regulator [Falsiroseomonas bella]